MLFMNRQLGKFAIIAAVVAVPASATAFGYDDPAVVDQVDVERYMGRWYEIAAIPQVFERDCFASQANYTLRKDGNVTVVNSCNKGSFDGDLESVSGVGRIVDPETNAKLKVRFFGAEGDYWILGLTEDYKAALVGTPARDALWVLSRTPTLDEAVYDHFVQQASDQGFDASKLERTPQL